MRGSTLARGREGEARALVAEVKARAAEARALVAEAKARAAEARGWAGVAGGAGVGASGGVAAAEMGCTRKETHTRITLSKREHGSSCSPNSGQGATAASRAQHQPPACCKTIALPLSTPTRAAGLASR